MFYTRWCRLWRTRHDEFYQIFCIIQNKKKISGILSARILQVSALWSLQRGILPKKLLPGIGENLTIISCKSRECTVKNHPQKSLWNIWKKKRKNVGQFIQCHNIRTEAKTASGPASKHVDSWKEKDNFYYLKSSAHGIRSNTPAWEASAGPLEVPLKLQVSQVRHVTKRTGYLIWSS